MAEISDEKRDQMNRLYFAAINFRKSQLKFCDNANCCTMKDLLDNGAILHQILTEINGGKDPVHFMSSFDSLRETAEMLAK